MAQAGQRELGCPMCRDEAEPGRIETDNNGPIVDCPLCADETERCSDCGAKVDGDGISIDDRCCFYCKGD